MFTVTRAMEEALLQHFIHQKLDIAYAINKPFPFFESLRDKSFITDRMYGESLEACRNLVPTYRVVYNILTKLEKTFNVSLLMTLFSPINLHEYPNLMDICESFRSAVPVGRTYEERSRTTALPLRAPTDPAEGRLPQTLPALTAPCPPSPKASEPTVSLQQIQVTLGGPPSTSDPAVPSAAPVQEGESTLVPKDNTTPEIKEKEDSREMPSNLPGTVQVVTDDSPGSKDPEELQEALSTPPKKKGKKTRNIWSTSKKRRQKKRCPRGAASAGHGIQEKLQELDQVTPRKDDPTWNSKMMTRAQKARSICVLESRSEEKLEDDIVDFLSPQLPVTCGEEKGILYKEKMKLGSSEKCIQNEEGVWFTPKEFAIQGKKKDDRNWKRSVRCRGKTLHQLLQNGLLFCPRGITPKRKVNGR